MSERITVRLDDVVYDRLMDAAKTRGTDFSSVVRQAVMAYLEGAGGTAPASVSSHTAEDYLAVVISHPSPRAQGHLTAVLARLDGILTRQGRSRLWFVAETLAVWVAGAEARTHAADP